MQEPTHGVRPGAGRQRSQEDLGASVRAQKKPRERDSGAPAEEVLGTSLAKAAQWAAAPGAARPVGDQEGASATADQGVRAEVGWKEVLRKQSAHQATGAWSSRPVRHT